MESTFAEHTNKQSTEKNAKYGPTSKPVTEILKQIFQNIETHRSDNVSRNLIPCVQMVVLKEREKEKLYPK